MNKEDIKLFTEAYISSDLLKIISNKSEVYYNFYNIYPNVNLDIYEKLSKKNKNITLNDFITYSEIHMIK